MTTVIKAAGAANFLGMVPQMLGYRPTESIVVIPFSGIRSIGAMRFDMPSFGVPTNPIASTVAGMVCRLDSADGIAVVAYSDEAVRYTEAVLRSIATTADHMGLRVVDSLYVTTQGWGSTLNDDGIQPLSLIVGEDVVPVGPGNQGTIIEPEIDDDLREAFTAALDVLETDESWQDTAALVEKIDALMSHPGTPDVDSLTRFSVWLSVPSLRDIGLITVCLGKDGGRRAIDAQQGWESGNEYPEDLAEVMWGRGARPDPARLERFVCLAHLVALLGDDPFMIGGAYGAAAWASWALGRSTHAEILAIRAHEYDPSHGLAEIVRSFVAAGHLPDWAFKG